MRDNVSEELLQLRKRARRRLVGAIALVLFALVVLWTVMDAAPPQNLLAASEPVVIEASAPSVAVAAPVPIAPRAQTASEALAALPGRLVNAQLGHASDPASATPPTAVATPQPTAAPTPKPKPTPKPTPDPKRILEGLDQADAKPAPAAGQKVYVQIGAYGDASKAVGIVGKLKAAGLAAYSEEITVKGVALTRVRIGPLAEAQAQKTRDQAVALGYAPQLVSK
ncbi:MAG TPA: SPOR domain-containing protein [Chitinolyticbacter sp.]|nr:SPOR domain-containing protein [Chitinolyticbacter sp.]